MRLEELQAERRRLKEETDVIFEDTQKTIDETNRVADVAHNAEQILQDIDQKFQSCTGLKKMDIGFLFVAVALQVVRQYIFTKFPERLDDQTAQKVKKYSMKEAMNVYIGVITHLWMKLFLAMFLLTQI